MRPPPAHRSVSPSPSVKSSAFYKGTELAGRTLLAALFLLSGLGKIGAIRRPRLTWLGRGSRALLRLSLATGGGADIHRRRRKTRITASCCGFTTLTALAFHTNFARSIQMIFS